jgi:gamma-glutamylcyclotransferase (GGCT)/AIG2-like uncharacterized protein YtfP
MNNIFTYGSLMFDRIWTRIVDGNYRKTEAVLSGYDRKGVKGEVYPAIYPSSIHSQIQGIVYLEVSAADLAKVDIFEGEYYYRKIEKVLTLDNRRVTAGVYVLKEEYYPLISHWEWDAVQFEKSSIHHFLADYTGFSDTASKYLK